MVINKILSKIPYDESDKDKAYIFIIIKSIERQKNILI